MAMGSYGAYMANQNDQLKISYDLINQQNKSLIETVELLKALFTGCKIHPSYKAKREPYGACEECKRIYAIRKQLEEKKVL